MVVALLCASAAGGVVAVMCLWPGRFPEHLWRFAVAVALGGTWAVVAFGVWLTLQGSLAGPADSDSAAIAASQAAEQAVFGSGLAVIGIGVTLMFRVFDWIRAGWPG